MFRLLLHISRIRNNSLANTIFLFVKCVVILTSWVDELPNVKQPRSRPVHENKTAPTRLYLHNGVHNWNGLMMKDEYNQLYNYMLELSTIHCMNAFKLVFFRCVFKWFLDGTSIMHAKTNHWYYLSIRKSLWIESVKAKQKKFENWKHLLLFKIFMCSWLFNHGGYEATA